VVTNGFTAKILPSNTACDSCVLTATGTTKLEGLGTARLSVGMSNGNLLGYLTGGLAFGNVKGTFFDPYMVDHLGGVGTASASQVRVGWTAGAGLEYAMTDRVSLNFVGLYYDLGNLTAIARATGTDNGQKIGDTYATYKDQLYGVVARAGINYKF